MRGGEIEIRMETEFSPGPPLGWQQAAPGAARLRLYPDTEWKGLERGSHAGCLGNSKVMDTGKDAESSVLGKVIIFV